VRENTLGVPPQITADQLFGVPSVEDLYKCPLCEKEFVLYKAFLAHWYDDHNEDERAEAGR
jgi:hypothetical protein